MKTQIAYLVHTTKGGEGVNGDSRKLYTAEEIAELYRVKPHCVYTWGRTGKIKRIKVGGRVMFYNPAEDKEAASNDVRND